MKSNERSSQLEERLAWALSNRKFFRVACENEVVNLVRHGLNEKILMRFERRLLVVPIEKQYRKSDPEHAKMYVNDDSEKEQLRGKNVMGN